MCSYLAASSAWPVLLGHRELLLLAADVVFVLDSSGKRTLPGAAHGAPLCRPIPVSCRLWWCALQCHTVWCPSRTLCCSVGLHFEFPFSCNFPNPEKPGNLLSSSGTTQRGVPPGGRALPSALVHTAEQPAACAPGWPTCTDPATTMTAVCVVAAACDLACADAGFRAAASAPGVTMVSALFELIQRADLELYRDGDAHCLLALMDFQFVRVVAAASGQVRGVCPCSKKVRDLGFDGRACPHTNCSAAA